MSELPLSELISRFWSRRDAAAEVSRAAWVAFSGACRELWGPGAAGAVFPSRAALLAALASGFHPVFESDALRDLGVRSAMLCCAWPECPSRASGALAAADAAQAALSRCSRCGTTFYCSREHQRADWPRHKLSCATPSAPAPEEAPAADPREKAFLTYWDRRVLRGPAEYGVSLEAAEKVRESVKACADPERNVALFWLCSVSGESTECEVARMTVSLQAPLARLLPSWLRSLHVAVVTPWRNNQETEEERVASIKALHTGVDDMLAVIGAHTGRTARKELARVYGAGGKECRLLVPTGKTFLVIIAH